MTGMPETMSITSFVIRVVFSKEIPGDRLMSTNITPWSSSGTKPDGVVFMKNTNNAIATSMTMGTIHLFLDKNLTESLYLFLSESKFVLKLVLNLWINPFLFSEVESCGFNNMAHSAGLKVNELMAEIIIAEAKVKPNCLKNTPDEPLINEMGINTAAITNVIAIITRLKLDIVSMAAFFEEV